MTKVSIHNSDGFNDYFREKKQDPNQVKKVRNLFYKRSFSLETENKKIPNQLMQLARDGIKTSFLKLEKRLDSKIDGASKIVFKTEDGLFIEAVILRIATGRVSLCISSQAGCKFGCTFCATGDMGFQRNLTYSEILDQVVQAQLLLKEENSSLRNIVFMGMGEPFDNFDNVCTAVKILTASDGFNFGSSNIMLSTCGVADKMIKFSEKFPDVSLALSLHSVSEEHREEVMPVNKKFGLSTLKQAILQINRNSSRSVMLEYLMFSSNTSDEDAEKLINFSKDLNVRINLIMYNPTNCTSEQFLPIAKEKMLQFKSALEAGKLTVTTRYSLGEDIDAACGQLASKSK